MNVLEKIGRFLFPYRYAFDEDNPEPIDAAARRERDKQLKGQGKKKDKKKKEKAAPAKPLDLSLKPVTRGMRRKVPKVYNEKRVEPDLDAVARGELGVEITEIQTRMTPEEAFERMNAALSHQAYYFHDLSYHQIAVKFEPGSAWRYYKRDEGKRKQLKPLLFPKSDVPFHRTHVIPVGYHGSENDSRLLVGFNGKLNSYDLNEFEQYIGDINKNEAVLWHVSIERQEDGSALWKAFVWDDEGDLIAADEFHDTDIFVWH